MLDTVLQVVVFVFLLKNHTKAVNGAFDKAYGGINASLDKVNDHWKND